MTTSEPGAIKSRERRRTGAIPDSTSRRSDLLQYPTILSSRVFPVSLAWPPGVSPRRAAASGGRRLEAVVGSSLFGISQVSGITAAAATMSVPSALMKQPPIQSTAGAVPVRNEKGRVLPVVPALFCRGGPAAPSGVAQPSLPTLQMGPRAHPPLPAAAVVGGLGWWWGGGSAGV